MLEQLDIQGKMKLFIETFNSSENETFEAKKTYNYHKKHQPPIWWDQNCFQQVKLRKQALKNYKLNGTLENCIECIKAMARAKRKFRQKAKKSWENVCNKLNKNTDLTDIWNQVNKFTKPFKTNN